MPVSDVVPPFIPEFVPTPATTSLISYLQAGAHADAVAVLDEHWGEIWYAIDPTDLRRLLNSLPEQTFQGFRNVGYLNALTGADFPEPSPSTGPGAGPRESPRESPAAHLNRVAQQVTDLRVQGRPAAAVALFPTVADDARALRGKLVDASGGNFAMWMVQAGITQLLAGDLTEARLAFREASATHRPDRFPFIQREALAKLALAHAAAGHVGEAASWSRRARQVPRTSSWVEQLVDDSLWLTDYLCAVDSLDLDRAEEMREDRPSPLDHLEFWALALHAQVRHLVLTRREKLARDLCDDLAGAGFPLPGSDGWLATTVDDARLLSLPAGALEAPEASATPMAVLAHRIHLLATGQYAPLTVRAPAETDADGDMRPRLALRLLRGQGLLHSERADEGRNLLASTLEEILDRGVLGVLRFLTADTATHLEDHPHGSQVAEIIAAHDIPLVVTEQLLLAPLTPAETTVLRLLRDGLSRGQIAATLVVSVDTVKSHLGSAYRKLQVSRRSDAIDVMDRLGM